ncbi:hypothetical protein ACKWTF_007531 [Chironomus riparius]
MFLKISFLSVLFAVAFCMPQNIEKESTTQKIETSSVVANKPAYSSQADIKKDKKNQGNLSNVSFGFLQTVRKEWKCADGQCQEQTTKCKNGKCEYVENRFKSNNYQPEVPQLAPIPFPSFNFAEFFNSFAFPKVDLESFFNFDNFGLMDSVVDTKNSDYYFTDAKIISSKCKNKECVISTKNCTNGKCNEVSERRSF